MTESLPPPQEKESSCPSWTLIVSLPAPPMTVSVPVAGAALDVVDALVAKELIPTAEALDRVVGGGPQDEVGAGRAVDRRCDRDRGRQPKSERREHAARVRRVLPM